MEQEKTKLSEDLDDWKQLAENLETELQSKVVDLNEKDKQLQETEEMLHDQGKRQDDLLNQIEQYEANLVELRESNTTKTKELQAAQQALMTTQVNLTASETREVTLNEESRELKKVSEQLVNQLRREKEAKKAIIEESHKSLEATREVLNSKAKKDLEELQENMNQLLNDERKAYRMKAEKASADFKRLEEECQRKLQDSNDEASATLEAKEREYKIKMKELVEKNKRDIDQVKKDQEAQRAKLIENGEAFIEDAKQKAKEALQEQVDQNVELRRALEEKDAKHHQQVNKNASLKKKLEYVTHQMNEMESAQDDLRDEIQKLQREKFKLEEEIEGYRRQLGGRYGVDGTMQNQVEKLSQELEDAHNENKRLKQKIDRQMSHDMTASFEVQKTQGYSRGGVHTSALTQIKEDYEEQISNLTEEKRELIMKNSSAIRDVQKSESLVWEREQEISRLKDEMTSLQLQLQRAQLVVSADENNIDASFYSHARDTSFATRDISFAVETSHIAENQSFRHENERPAVAGSTPVKNERVLTPSGKHENSCNDFSDSTSSACKSTNAYQLRREDIETKSPLNRLSPQMDDERTIVDYTQQSENSSEADNQAECAQS